MTNQPEALKPESANILIIVAARLVRLECLTPLHTLSELGQKSVGTRALQDAIDQVEERLLREAAKIRTGHDRLAEKLKKSEAALEQSQQLLSDGVTEEALTLHKRIAELETSHAQVIQARDHYKSLVSASQSSVKLPEQYPDDGELSFCIDLYDDPEGDFRLAMWLKELRRRRAGITVQGDE